MREFHVWLFSPWRKTYNAYCEVLEDVKEVYDGINTQNLVFCDMKIITKYGYRLFIGIMRLAFTIMNSQKSICATTARKRFMSLFSEKR